MKKIKVLHILNQINYSGAELMISGAASMWINNGIEMHILSTGKKKGNFAPKLKAKKCKIYHIPFEKNISFFSKIYKLMKKKKFDIVHIHPERADIFYSLITRLALGYKVGLIRTVHHLFRFSTFLRIRKLVERKISLHILRTKFISNSPSGQINEKKNYLMNNKLISNWYDDKIYFLRKTNDYHKIRKQLNIPNNISLFLSIGKFTYYKNYNSIVDALSLISKREKILFLQIGGNNQILDNYIKKKDEEKRAKTLGNVKDVKKYFTAADVFIMPSLEEGFGVAAVEAMACGLPCILSNVIALSDFKKKIKGITYVNLNTKSISKAMINYHKLNKSERFAKGKKLSLQVKKYFGLNAGPKEFLNLYRGLSFRKKI